MEQERNDELPPAYSPQEITDILPIYRPSDNDSHIHSYIMHQTAPGSYTLSCMEDTSAPPLFHIKTFKSGGFMNRKPHIIFSRDPNEKTTTAEARFDVHGTGTSIIYTDPPSTQRLELEDSRQQLLRTTIHGLDRWWQPFPGNKDVLELTNDMDEILARFVCQKSSTPPASPGKRKFTPSEIGRLHVVDALVSSEDERLEILCSSMVVVERAKRRAAILNNGASAYGVVRSMSAPSASYIPQ